MQSSLNEFFVQFFFVRLFIVYSIVFYVKKEIQIRSKFWTQTNTMLPGDEPTQGTGPRAG